MVRFPEGPLTRRIDCRERHISNMTEDELVECLVSLRDEIADLRAQITEPEPAPAPAESEAESPAPNYSLPGELNPSAKLTNAQVHLIRSAPKSVSHKMLADAFGVTITTIRFARYGHSWQRHSTPPQPQPKRYSTSKRKNAA